MAWFKKVRKPIEPLAENQASRVPEGLWVKCPSCGEVIYNKDLAGTLNVCPKCAHHFRIGAAAIGLRAFLNQAIGLAYQG